MSSVASPAPASFHVPVPKIDTPWSDLFERICAIFARIRDLFGCTSETLDDCPVSPLTSQQQTPRLIGITPVSPLSPRTPTPLAVVTDCQKTPPPPQELPEEDIFALAQNADPEMKKRLIFSGLLCPSVFLPLLPLTSAWKSLDVRCANYKEQRIIQCEIQLKQPVTAKFTAEFSIFKREITYKTGSKISWSLIPETGEFFLGNQLEFSFPKHTFTDGIWIRELDACIQQSPAFQEWKKGTSEMTVKFPFIHFFCKGGIFELDYPFQLKYVEKIFAMTPVRYSGPVKQVLEASKKLRFFA